MHYTQFTSNAILILRHSTYYTLRMRLHILYDANYTIPATLYFTVPCCATLCRTKFVMTTALRMLYGTYYSTQSVFTHELFCCTYFILHGVFYVLHSAIRTITYHTYCTRHVVHIVQHTHITRSNHTVVPLLLYEVYQRY